MELITLFMVLLVTFFVFYVKTAQNYWKIRGVPHEKPTFLIGNIWQSVIGCKHIGEVITDIYKKHSDCKYVGFYAFLKPAIIIRDPKLVLSVLTKDFDYFSANGMTVDESVDIILAKNPFSLNGQMWKIVRGQLSPNFTNAKIKSMFPTMKEVCNSLVDYLNSKDKNCIDVRNISLRFTTEIVTSCAFGLKGQAFEDNESDFLNLARHFEQISYLNYKKFYILLFPWLTKLFKVKFLSDFATNHFIKTVEQTLKYREENGIVRNDFLDAMKEEKQKCTKYEFTNSDVVAHVAGIFEDSNETTSLVLTSLLYKLALNSDVQSKLVEEITRNKQELSYEAVQKMMYLDRAFKETLRKHPVDFFYLKLCTKRYKLPTTRGEKEIFLERGTSVFLPVEALQYDDQYFPEPDTFNPDRFSENEPILKGTFLPFGGGPRMCLGMKLGIFQVKMAAIAIVKNFVIKLNPKTSSPLKMNPNWLLRRPLEEIWIHLENRSVV